PGINRDDAVVCFRRGRGDDAWSAEPNGVEDVNFQRRLTVDGSWLVGNSVHVVKALKHIRGQRSEDRSRKSFAHATDSEISPRRVNCGQGYSLIVFIIVKRLGLLYAASFYS